MKYSIVNAALVNAVLVSLCLLVSHGSLSAADNIQIDVSDDDIAITANNATLNDVLLEIERLTGIPVNFDASNTERVSLNIGMTSVENAIAKITPNHMIVHEMQQGKQVIKELIVIPQDSGNTNAGQSSFLPSGNPAPAVEPQMPDPNMQDPNAQDPNMQDPGTAQPLQATVEPNSNPQIMQPETAAATGESSN